MTYTHSVMRWAHIYSDFGPGGTLTYFVDSLFSMFRATAVFISVILKLSGSTRAS